MKAKTIEEYFGTLQETFISTWRSHLATNKYTKHIALNEFYDDIPDEVDGLIEQYMGIHGKVENLTNVMEDGLDAVEYLKTMRQFVIDGRDDFFKEDTELCSQVDNILSLIDQTVYKLENLTETEHVSLVDFINESMK